MNDQHKLAIVVFNLTVIAYVLGMQLFVSAPAGWGAFFLRVLIGAGIGAVLGGITFFVAGMGKR